MQKHWCNNHCFCMFMRAVCVCMWSCCLKESSSDGAWKPCSAAVLPVHRQLHCWALNTRSALTPARTLHSSLWIFRLLSLPSLAIHSLRLATALHLNLYIARLQMVPLSNLHRLPHWFHLCALAASLSVVVRSTPISAQTPVWLNALLTSQS